MPRITLRPLGEIAPTILEELKKRLGETFGCPVEVEPGSNDLAHAYNPKRKQFLSTSLLSNLTTSRMEKGGRVLGIVDVDLYVPVLNFVFGEADVNSGVAIISLWRLRQERCGLPSNMDLFKERAVKEAIHELGHTHGLRVKSFKQVTQL